MGRALVALLLIGCTCTTSSRHEAQTRTTTTRTFTHRTGASGPLWLRVDEHDCLDGWLSMDVVVELEGERERLRPSCNFTFHETFELAGRRCTAESGMCSSFMNRGRMIVDCGGTDRRQVRFSCPDR